jgi:hypothetical protein
MAGLFLIDPDGRLTQLSHSDYDSEDLLQGLLADYPDLLGGDQMGDGVPRVWLFVAREAPVPDKEGSSGRWSLDHLFLDQDAIPTFVEVKRASDSRIRREVVGQMLDYAANGLLYWPVEAIQGFLAQKGTSADERLVEAFGTEIDTAEYWRRLRENISDGRIRLLFVADKIPSELLAVVEFLNTHMDHTEVLAVEIPQFTGEGIRTLAPRVLGQTQEAVQKKAGTRTPPKWDEDRVFDLMSAKLPPADVAVARRYFDWIVEQGWPVAYGRGKIDGSFIGTFSVGGKPYVYPIVCYTFGRFEIGLAWMQRYAPFDRPEMRLEFVRRLSLPPEIGITDEVATAGKFPSVPFSTFATDDAFKALTETILWYKAEAEPAISVPVGSGT